MLSEPVGQAIAAVLERGNAFLEVEGAEREPATILIQEEGMHAKPSVGQRLSVLDILRYWSLSSAEEKLALLETQLQLHGAMMTIGESVMGSTLTSDGSSMFDRFAGIFHAFDCMERVAREYLDNDTPREAAYRVFGSKADSLGRVLDQIAGSPEDTKNLLPNYVIVLCAQQVIDGLEREYPEFWAQHRQEAKRLRQRLHIKARLRERLLKTYDDIDSGFLAWFERQFLAREGMRGAS